MLLNLLRENASVYDRVVRSNLKNYRDSSIERYKYHENCQKCVQAFELEMRGYDVEAMERPTNNTDEYNDLLSNGWDMAMYVEGVDGFEAYGHKWFFGDKGVRTTMKPLVSTRVEKQKEDIIRIVKEAGDGARFSCSIAWQGTSSGHCCNIINDNGEVRFIDSQSGNDDASYFFRKGNIKPSETMIVRVDNLEINDYVKNIAKGRGE